MFTRDEIAKMHRDDMADKLADFIEADGEAYEEIMEIALEIAADEYDCDCDSDGFFDCTNYQRCAERAFEQWADAKQAEYEGRGDYLYDLAGDR